MSLFFLSDPRLYIITRDQPILFLCPHVQPTSFKTHVAEIGNLFVPTSYQSLALHYFRSHRIRVAARTRTAHKNKCPSLVKERHARCDSSHTALSLRVCADVRCTSRHMCGEIIFLVHGFQCAKVGVSFQGQTSIVRLRMLPLAAAPCHRSTLSTNMRGLGALVAIHRLLLASAFISPISTVLRSNSAFQTANRRILSNPAARRLRLLARPDVENGDGDDRSAALRPGKPVLSFPGGGIFFWWQAGAISALQERYNLSSVEFVGASAGALAATLAACDADMDLAMTLALELCDTNEVWSRPLGLAGVWGAMVEDWLDELLPEDADSICRDRVHLLMLGVWPEPGKRLAVSDFTSKDDLIKSCMASVHIPYFMNQKLTALHRESRYVDGSFRASREDLSLGPNKPTVYFDYEDDMVMAERRGNFLSLTNQDGLLFMRQRGYEHVQAMVADGKLDCIREEAVPSRRRNIVSDR